MSLDDIATRTVFRRTGKSFCGGFSIVSAIFLLVVLAGLGVAMVNISTVQHTSSALDVQGTRAYQAARAGIEWGLFQALQPPTAGTYCAGPGPVTNTIALPANTTLSQFAVTVTCTPTVYTDTTPGIAVTPNVTVFQITSVACNRPAAGNCPNPALNQGSDYVQRQLQISFSTLAG